MKVGTRGGERGEGRREICKKLYLRSSFRNIDPLEKERETERGGKREEEEVTPIEEPRQCSGRPQSGRFFFSSISKNLKRSSKRSLPFLPRTPSTTVEIVRVSFYFCWFIGCRGRKDEGP